MMQRYRTWTLLALLPAFALFVLGCGGDKQDKPKTEPGPKPSASGHGDKGGGAAAAKGAAGGMTAVEGTGAATLKGKVTYDGTPPPPADLKPFMEKQQDKDHCLKGPTADPTWMVGADKGVKNVVVWLRPPEGKFFKAEAPKGDVTMDQPFCLFEPHVVAFAPMMWDPDSKIQKPTGQKFVVKNSAPIPHNTAWSGTNKLVNSGKNEILKAKEGAMPVDAKPGKTSEPGGEELLTINCDIHKWMTAKAVVLDHPYFAVTNEKGEYEIKNAPAGAEVVVAYWHETFPGNTLKQAAKTDKITLKAGDNEKNFTVK